MFIDECGSHLDLTRSYARAPRGQRAVGVVPRNRGPATTLIAGLSLSGIQAPLVLIGGTTKAVFQQYVTQVLLPSLEPGQIVVWDNLGAHRATSLRAQIEATGAELWVLPTYSPDLSPIELAFSKCKATLRRIGARTREALEAAIATALEAITTADACGWFTHCGYAPLDQL